MKPYLVSVVSLEVLDIGDCLHGYRPPTKLGLGVIWTRQLNGVGPITKLDQIESVL